MTDNQYYGFACLSDVDGSADFLLNLLGSNVKYFHLDIGIVNTVSVFL